MTTGALVIWAVTIVVNLCVFTWIDRMIGRPIQWGSNALIAVATSSLVAAVAVVLKQ